ncbi:MAG TPA: hypothetical protein VHW93_04870, partial [Acidimicrobiales bacterium]|nr:hypothetical protein [Acidimicrobiales bacterium]
LPPREAAAAAAAAPAAAGAVPVVVARGHLRIGADHHGSARVTMPSACPFPSSRGKEIMGLFFPRRAGQCDPARSSS